VIKNTILKTRDGAASTIKYVLTGPRLWKLADRSRHTVHDDIAGSGSWPALYDGRAVKGQLYEEFASGKPVSQLVSQQKEAVAAKDFSKSIVWA